MDFFYSFTVTMMHSIWQAALLLFVYMFINLLRKNYHPLQKRNFLYVLLLAQFSISVITFFSFLNSYNFKTISRFSDFFQNSPLLFLQNYYEMVFMAYISIVSIKIFQLIFQWASFKKNYTKQLKRPTADLKIFTAYHASLLSLKNSVTLWCSNSIKTPVTFGFLKPIILLPISLINNITNEQAELIILHELIHIKSKDYLLNWFLIAMETVYFFNPFIKITAEKLKLEREKNCDIQVLNYQYSSVKYAETLFEIAQNHTQLKRFQLGVFKNNSQLYKRITFFSGAHNSSFRKINFYFLSFLFVLLTGTISFLMISKSDLPTKKFLSVSINRTQESFQKNKIIALPIDEKAVVILKDKKSNENGIITQNEDKILFKNPTLENAEIIPENMYTPVSYFENTDSAQEVIYNVETKNTTTTQAYRLVKKNGIWIFEPKWMIVETRPDSAHLQIKDSTYSAPGY